MSRAIGARPPVMRWPAPPRQGGRCPRALPSKPSARRPSSSGLDRKLAKAGERPPRRSLPEAAAAVEEARGGSACRCRAWPPAGGSGRRRPRTEEAGRLVGLQPATRAPRAPRCIVERVVGPERKGQTIQTAPRASAAKGERRLIVRFPPPPMNPPHPSPPTHLLHFSPTPLDPPLPFPFSYKTPHQPLPLSPLFLPLNALFPKFFTFSLSDPPFYLLALSYPPTHFSRVS